MKQLILAVLLLSTITFNGMEEAVEISGKVKTNIDGEGIVRLSEITKPVLNLITKQLVDIDFLKKVYQLYIEASYKPVLIEWSKNQLVKIKISPTGKYLLQKTEIENSENKFIEKMFILNLSTNEHYSIPLSTSCNLNYCWINDTTCIQSSQHNHLLYSTELKQSLNYHNDHYRSKMEHKSLSPNEKFIACSYKNEIKIINISDFSTLLTMTNQLRISSFDWSPASDHIAISYQESPISIQFIDDSCQYSKRTVEIWNLESKKLLKKFENIYETTLLELESPHIKWSFNGKIVALISNEEKAKCLKTVLLYNPYKNIIEKIDIPLNENIKQLFFIIDEFLYLSTDHKNFLYNFKNGLIVSLIPNSSTQCVSQNGEAIICIDKEKKIKSLYLPPILKYFKESLETPSLSTALVFLICDTYLKNNTFLNFDTLPHQVVKDGLQEIRANPILSAVFKKLCTQTNYF